MKILSLVLLVAGLLTGPAYWIYAKFFTGSRVALVNLEKSASAGPAASWRSAEFILAPEMAPVGLILKASGSFSPNMDENRPPRDRYAATLYRDGEAAKPLGFTLGVKNVSDSNPVFKEHLVFFQVVKGGRYHLEVTPAAEPDIKIDRMQLEARQHLHEPDNRIVTAGMVVMVLGILGFVM
jgi:hypothetical protein